MRLERLALWAERYLFTEQGEMGRGFIGWLRGHFEKDRLVLADMTIVGEQDDKAQHELESLCAFLAGESAGYMLRTLSDLNAFCWDKIHDHIPYSFDRECWGFRVLTEDFAWYIALTPWNPKRHVTIYCYNCKALMTALAKEKGLPEYCYGVLKYTGERILIRYGGDEYESFPQYGNNMAENRAYANEQNEALNLTVEQVAAMKNAVIFGWDTPMANPENYDENGRFCMTIQTVKQIIDKKYFRRKRRLASKQR